MPSVDIAIKRRWLRIKSNLVNLPRTQFQKHGALLIFFIEHLRVRDRALSAITRHIYSSHYRRAAARRYHNNPCREADRTSQEEKTFPEHCRASKSYKIAVNGIISCMLTAIVDLPHPCLANHETNEGRKSPSFYLLGRRSTRKSFGVKLRTRADRPRLSTCRFRLRKNICV